ncbi:MAG: DUF2975 domain-containing protein [Desulfosporosinus sp.]|nr:DUF2975 domain-containing protein [Desulfosporosinus sp.]
MDNRDRIRLASRRLRFLLLSLLFLMPVVDGLVWLNINRFPEMIYKNILPYFVVPPLPVPARCLGFVVAMIPIGVAMCGAYHLMRLFALYEQGCIFMLDNVRCFKKLSYVLIWWFVAGIAYNSLLSVALTLHNPPGQRMITLELSSSDLTALLLGGILAVIAWVMEEGRKLQEDQDFTV